MGSLSRGTKAELFSILPAGTVLPYAGGTAPDGWAICDGSTVSRTEYSELYMAIGDAWGNGDGSTTFHLPDLRGRFLRGVDSTAGRDPDSGSRTAANAGGNTGDNVGSVQDDAAQGHRHISGVYFDGGGGSGVSFGQQQFDNPSPIYTGSPIADGGSGTPRISTENRSKNANMNYIIKL